MSKSKELNELMILLVDTDERLYQKTLRLVAAEAKLKEAEKALLALENGCSSFLVMQILKGVFA